MSLFGFHSFWEVNAYITFVLLGMSVMMVLSTILSAPSFFAAYYIYATGKPDAICEKPYFWNNVLTFFFAIMFGVQFICEALTLTPLVRRIPLRLRLIVGLFIPFIEMLILIIIPIVKIPTQDGAIAVMMAVSVLTGFSKAIIDSTNNALSGPFPTRFVNGEQWGLTISPLLMSIVQIILMGSMSNSFDDVLVQSRIYFGIGLFFQIVTIVELLILDKNPFAQKYTAEFRFKALQRSKANCDNKCNTSHLENGEGSLGHALSSESMTHEGDDGLNANMKNTTKGNVVINNELKAELGTEEIGMNTSNTNVADEEHRGAGTTILTATGDADKVVDVDQLDNVTSADQMLRASVIDVIKKVWPMLFCTFFVYFVSLLLFPGLFFKAAADMSGWYPTLIILFYNVGDFVSRMLLMYRPLRPSPKVVLGGTIARLAIIPVLVLCSVHIIKGDALPYVLVSLLSLTNGYFGTMAYMLSPRTPTLSKAGERSLAGILSGIFLMLGLCFGSNLALLVNLFI